MPIVTGLGTSWNLPNYAGELFTADMQTTPLLSMIGGLTGGMMTTNPEFPTAQLFKYPDPSQPGISERQSAVAPSPRHISREQETNVVQIHQTTIEITYHKQASMGRMSGVNTAGQQPSPTDELAWQITHSALIPAARDIEYSFIRGAYHKSTGDNDASKTRGMLELCEDGNSIDAAGAPLSRELLQNFYRLLADGGAYFDNMVMFAGAKRVQQLTDIYAAQMGFNLPATRDVGGVAITSVVTDFFNMGIVWNRFMPPNDLLLCDVAHMAPVFMEVPGKGVLFVEELAKVGASERRHMYGEIGLAHGPAFLHGSITGLGA